VFVITALLVAVAVSAAAATERGIVVYPGTIYIAPDAASAKLSDVERGREIVVLEKGNGEWLHVLASVTGERDVTGWMDGKMIITPATPDGDKILYGEAVNSENEASRRGGRRGADKDAMRLYYRMAEYFPQSPLAGESMYRSADVKWQLDRAEAMSRPSWRNTDPDMRPKMDEEMMREVRKKFSHTKWDDMATFHLLENKLCGDWKAESKCPSREAEMYEKYADERPQSPNAAEALYLAAFRRAALIQIYGIEHDAGKAADAKNKAIAIAQKVTSQYAQQTDLAARAATLLYMVQQGIPTYTYTE
jgi:hypothetical protein